MQETDQSNERFHQMASAQYLQGKFEEALATWKQILTNNPEDERAKEGVRLCALLTQDGASAAEEAAPASEPVSADAASAVSGDAPASDAADVAAPEVALEFEIPNLELDLPETEPPDPERQSEGIDLGTQPETLQVDGEIPEAPAPEPEPIVEPEPAETEVGAVVEGIFEEDTEPVVGEAGTAELGRRAQDLLSEARAAHDAGDNETAAGVLKRVFILDADNAEALELQEQIEGGVPPTTEHVDVADLDAPDHNAAPGGLDLAADAPEALTVADEPAAETLDDPAADDFPDFDVDAEFEEPEVDEDDEVEPSTGKIKLPQFDIGSSKTRWIVIGVLAGVFVVVAVGFWMKLRAIDEPREVPPPIVQPVEAAPDPVAPAQVAPVAPEPAAGPPAALTEDVATLLDRGNAALDAGKYSQAVVAFDAVLKQQPNNLEANEKMQAASEGYRRQQEIQAQWIAATSLFRDSEFRSALQMFYRLPQDSEEDRVRIARYQENGWYNLGLLALRSGQCDRALGHFEEAAQIDPEDADVAMALALCETCESGTGRSGFQRAMASMKMRSLDD